MVKIGVGNLEFAQWRYNELWSGHRLRNGQRPVCQRVNDGIGDEGFSGSRVDERAANKRRDKILLLSRSKLVQVDNVTVAVVLACYHLSSRPRDANTKTQRWGRNGGVTNQHPQPLPVLVTIKKSVKLCFPNAMN